MCMCAACALRCSARALPAPGSSVAPRQPLLIPATSKHLPGALAPPWPCPDCHHTLNSTACPLPPHLQAPRALGPTDPSPSMDASRLRMPPHPNKQAFPATRPKAARALGPTDPSPSAAHAITPKPSTRPILATPAGRARAGPHRPQPLCGRVQAARGEHAGGGRPQQGVHWRPARGAHGRPGACVRACVHAWGRVCASRKPRFLLYIMCHWWLRSRAARRASL